VAYDFLPKCTQIEEVVTTVSVQNSIELTLPLSSEHKKKLGKTLTLIKNDEIFALGNVLSGTHIETAKTSGSGHHLVSRTTLKAPEYQNTLEATMLASNMSHAERVTTTRSTSRATTTTTTAYNGPKSYAVVVGNVSIVSQVDKSQKKSFAQVLQA
ncbi:Hypothetical predicted protein, partial [Olea europaea subsp. europaea]